MQHGLIIIFTPHYIVSAFGGPGDAHLLRSGVAQVPHEDTCVDVPGMWFVRPTTAFGEEGGIGPEIGDKSCSHEEIPYLLVLKTGNKSKEPGVDETVEQ